MSFCEMELKTHFLNLYISLYIVRHSSLQVRFLLEKVASQ